MLICVWLPVKSQFNVQIFNGLPQLVIINFNLISPSSDATFFQMKHTYLHAHMNANAN